MFIQVTHFFLWAVAPSSREDEIEASIRRAARKSALRRARLGKTPSERHIEETAPSRMQYIQVEALPVTSVACGSDHVLAVAGGSVFAWGCPDGGRLGCGEEGPAADMDGVCVPHQVPALCDHHTIQVAASSGSSAAVTRDGEVWVWGSNDEGQLGLGCGPDDDEFEEELWEPQRLTGFTGKVPTRTILSVGCLVGCIFGCLVGCCICNCSRVCPFVHLSVLCVPLAAPHNGHLLFVVLCFTRCLRFPSANSMV